MIESVSYLATEAVWSFGILAVFGVAGLGPMLLFKDLIRFPLLASPLTGLLLVNTSTLPIYFIFYVTYKTAALCAAAVWVVVSIFLCAAHWKNLRATDTTISVMLIAVMAICVGCLTNAATIQNGSPSIVYLDGSDHLGYANVADWMRDHIGRPGIDVRGVDGPRADPAHPFESMPNIMLNSEPRNGAFGFLALMSLIRQVSSTFAYDPASGVFLSAAILGVAAVFARSWLAFTILTLGLAFSIWYEFSHAGYLAKAMAYPATVFSLGLFLAGRRMNDVRVLFVILMMCVGSALLLSGVVTGTILGTLGGSAVLISCIFDNNMDWNQISRLVLCIFVSVLAGGFFVHPVNGYWLSGVVYPASFVAPRALDLEGWTAATGFDDTTLNIMIAVAVLVGIGAAWVAFVRRSSGALSLLIVPIIVYFILLLFTSRVELFQTSGLLYPAMLCGFGILVSDLQYDSRRGLVIVAIGGAVVTIALRSQHELASVRRYTSPEVIALAYTKKEIDEVVKAIGQRSALIDVGKSPHPSILMLVELGRRGLTLQWTEDTWLTAVAGWRGWPLPKYETSADLRIVRADRKDMEDAIYVGPHFAVLRNKR